MRDTLTRAASRARRAKSRAGLSRVARTVLDERLTYLPDRSLRNLERCVRSVGSDGVPGVLIECGVALGGSSIVIASLMPDGRRFRGYDVFDMIPAPGARDDQKSHARYELIASGRSHGIKGDSYYGYEEDLLGKVVETFEAHGLNVDGEEIALHKGPFEETLHLDDEPVAFAHLDCDWYDSVWVCLERIYPNLAPGGFIVSDDYHTYGGCTRAVDEFLAQRPDMRKVDDGQGPPDRTTNLILRRHRVDR